MMDKEHIVAFLDGINRFIEKISATTLRSARNGLCGDS